MQQNFEEELVKTQHEVQDQTLKTIATEIHDNIGQILSITKLTLSSIDIQNEPIKSVQKVGHALTLVDTSIKELRHLAAVLYAENLLKAGLENAISNELNWLSKSGEYEICWNVLNENSHEVDPERGLIAFRLIQELFNNIIKHAAATCIEVDFVCANNAVEIKVHDNGKGFDVDQYLARPTGMGIINLFKRARLINGNLDLISGDGNGTTAILRFPCP